MGIVLKMEKQQQMQALAGMGWSNRAISSSTGIDRDTVSKYRSLIQNPPEVPTETQNTPDNVLLQENEGTAADQNSPNVPSPNLRHHFPPPTAHNLDHLFPSTSRNSESTLPLYVLDLVEKYDYKGSYDRIKRYVLKLRKRHRRYRERLDHLPGYEAQVDFGKSTCTVKINGRYRHVWLFKMTLSSSKHAYEENWLSCRMWRRFFAAISVPSYSSVVCRRSSLLII